MVYTHNILNELASMMFAAGITIESEVNTENGMVRIVRSLEGKEWHLHYHGPEVVKIVRVYADGTTQEV